MKSTDILQMLMSLCLNIGLCLYIFSFRKDASRVRQYKRAARFLLTQLLAYKDAKRPRKLSIWLKIRLAIYARSVANWKKFCVLVDARTLEKWKTNLWLLLFKALWRFWSESDKKGNSLPKAVIRFLHQLMSENPHWGGVRLWSQMKQLGFKISLRSVYNHKRKYFPRPNLGSWWDLIREPATLAIDFTTIPIVTSAVIKAEVYIFFIIENASRRILYLNTTKNPTTEWVKQQFRNAEFDSQHTRIVMDNDRIFSKGFAAWLKSRYNWTVLRTTFQSPWQNPYAERWAGSIKNELLHRRIFTTENSLRLAALQYVAYYNLRRPHSSLMGRTPDQLSIPPTPKDARLLRTRHFGLENSYQWASSGQQLDKAA